MLKHWIIPFILGMLLVAFVPATSPANLFGRKPNG